MSAYPPSPPPNHPHDHGPPAYQPDASWNQGQYPPHPGSPPDPYPGQAGGPPGHVPAGDAGQRRRSGPGVAVALGILVVGVGLGVGAGWFLDDEAVADEPSQAELDAAHACGIVDRLGVDWDLGEIGSYDEDPEPELARAIGELTTAASLADPTYDALAEQGIALREAMYIFSTADVSVALHGLTDECTTLGLGGAR